MPQSLTEREATWDLVVGAFVGSTGNSWVRVSCPICARDDGKVDAKRSLGLNPATRGYHCFRCGTKGKLPPRFMERIDTLEAIAEDAPKPTKPPVEIAEGFRPLSCSDSSLDFARTYLAKRGLPEDVLYSAGVGAAAYGRLRGRVIVPIPNYVDPFRPWRGWVSRDATGRAERPYMYPRHMDRLGLLYNQPALAVATDKPVMVVEGTLDALALWPDAVAVLGKPLDSQIELLTNARRPVCVVLDGDAWREGWLLALTLRHLGQKSGSIKLPPGVDPDECDRLELEQTAGESITDSTACTTY